MNIDFLLPVLAFLGFSLIFVTLSSRLGLGGILGYLVAGLIIGPSALNLIPDVTFASHLSELGIVFLLFVIGLELEPEKLWGMRKSLLLFGGSEILFCALIFTLIAAALGLDWVPATVVGFSLSLSSTAVGLQSLEDKKALKSEHGQLVFSTLLMQDVAAIPALAIIPTLGLQTGAQTSVHWLGFLTLVASLGVVSKTLFSPFMRILAETRSRDLFTGITLLVVMAVAYLTAQTGLSMALGSFIAGVFFSRSEFKHELEADIAPFKGLLMGLFFISVGMSMNVGLFLEEPLKILLFTLGFVVIKFLALYLLIWSLGLKTNTAQNYAAFIFQGSEFAFVILGLGQASKVLAPQWSERLILVISFSMVLSPFVLLLNERIQSWRLKKNLVDPKYDTIENEDNEIILAGYGRFTQMVGRILKWQGIPFTAIDMDSELIEALQKYSVKIYYGDASRADILEAAGVKKAKYFIIGIDDVETSLKLAHILHSDYPHLKVFSRARDRIHAHSLMDHGIENIFRETMGSGLFLAKNLLIEIGMPEERAKKIVHKFALHDQFVLKEQYKFRGDEKRFVDIARQGIEELEKLMAEEEGVSFGFQEKAQLEQNQFPSKNSASIV